MPIVLSRLLSDPGRPQPKVVVWALTADMPSRCSQGIVFSFFTFSLGRLALAKKEFSFCLLFCSFPGLAALQHVITFSVLSFPKLHFLHPSISRFSCIFSTFLILIFQTSFHIYVLFFPLTYRTLFLFLLTPCILFSHFSFIFFSFHVLPSVFHTFFHIPVLFSLCILSAPFVSSSMIYLLNSSHLL